MKTINQITKLIAIAFITMLIASCSKNEVVPAKEGSFTLGFQDAGLKSDIQLTDIYVSIENDKGELVYNMYKMPLLRTISGSYLTESIRLQEGYYMITAFMVASENEIIYLTPKRGSEKAYLVSQPLPIDFKVAAGQTTHIVPEVVRAEGGINPEEYGYASFSFVIVDEPQQPQIDFNGQWEMCTKNGSLSPEYYIEECVVVELFQDMEYITLYNEEQGIKWGGYINGKTIYFDTETGDTVTFQIINDNYLLNYNEYCDGCPVTSLTRIPEVPTVNCFNFLFEGELDLDASISIMANGEKTIINQPLRLGVNTIEFENIYDYYTVNVYSPVVDCYAYSYYLISQEELENYSCEKGDVYPVTICGGNVRDSIIYYDYDKTLESKK